MRLMATEDDIYKLMDLRDRYLLGSILGGVAVAISFYLLTEGKWYWDIVYLFVASSVGIFLFVRQICKINRKIMGAENCYLELEKDCLVVCQPEKNGHYESCRIFYEEIEKIVEGSRRGIPEFYIVLTENEEENESFILLDDEEEKRRIFCVRSLGYETQKFIQFYRKLLWQVPGQVRVLGTKQQDIWKMKRPHKGVCIMVSMMLIYIVPKIIEIMGIF